MNISPADVESVLSSANNLNAALKTLLKREGKPENSIESFVKSMRPVVARNRDGELLKYVEQHYPTKEVHFALLAAYAFPAVRESLINSVFEKHAENFNKTYERSDNGIKITDAAKFQSIIEDVVVMVKGGLEQAGVPRNNFSVYSVLVSIFEPDVLEQVVAKLGL